MEVDTNSTPSFFGEAIELNNMACAAIRGSSSSSSSENAMLQDAVSKLTSALSLSRNVLEDMDGTDTTTINVTSSQICCLDDWMKQSLSNGRATNPVKNETLSVYSRPIPIFFTSDGATTQPRSNGVMISVAIVFNLALAHHLAAEKYDLAAEVSTNKQARTSAASRSSHFYRKAARLYELGYNLLQEHQGLQTDGINGNTNETSSSPLFIMATMNNIASIYQSLQEYDHSKTMYQQLVATILHMTEYTGGLGTSVVEFDDGFFFYTISKYLFDDPSFFMNRSAPAA